MRGIGAIRLKDECRGGCDHDGARTQGDARSRVGHAAHAPREGEEGERRLRIANDKAEGLTIRKLTNRSRMRPDFSVPLPLR